MKRIVFCGIAWGFMIFSCASFARAAVTYSVVAQLGAVAPGYTPNQIVEAGDGNYYGTTAYGGTNNNGTLFRITPGGTVTQLYAFTGGNDGSRPLGVLALGNDGKLYGTTTLKGATGDGTFFSITTSGTFTTLHAFNGTSEGGAPTSSSRAAMANSMAPPCWGERTSHPEAPSCNSPRAGSSRFCTISIPTWMATSLTPTLCRAATAPFTARPRPAG